MSNVKEVADRPGLIITYRSRAGFRRWFASLLSTWAKRNAIGQPSSLDLITYGLRLAAREVGHPDPPARLEITPDDQGEIRKPGRPKKKRD